MRIVFFGTPLFSARILEFLFEKKKEIVSVVTRPDKPQGRSRKVRSSPVKEYILSQHPEIPLFQPERASSEEFVETIASFKPDLFVVVAYGEIMRGNLLKVPRLMPINIHASILPKYRGAAPIQRAIMNGEKKMGITIIEMVRAMDAGDMLHIESMDVTTDLIFSEIEEKLCRLSCLAIEKVINDFECNRLTKRPQNPDDVTFAAKITPEDCLIKWHNTAEQIHNQVRALSPRPGAYFETLVGSEVKRVKVLRSRALDLAGESGSVIECQKRLIIGCGVGALEILELQVEGRSKVKAQEFLRGSIKPIHIKQS